MRKAFIAQCEQEALHRSGMIQPHGALLICSADLRVTHASANLADYTGRPPVAWLGQPLPDELARLNAMLPGEVGARAIISRTLDERYALDVVATRTEAGGLLLELIPAQEEWVLAPPQSPHPAYATGQPRRIACPASCPAGPNRQADGGSSGHVLRFPPERGRRGPGRNL